MPSVLKEIRLWQLPVTWSLHSLITVRIMLSLTHKNISNSICQEPCFRVPKQVCQMMLNILTAERMTHRSSYPLQSSNSIHHYYYYHWTIGRKRWLFCWFLIAFVTLTALFCFTYLLLGDSSFFLKKKIILIVSSIIQCFYQMCMFIYQILDDIFKWFNMF